MIPPDLASRLQSLHPEPPPAPQAVGAVQRLPEILSNLVPGQRVMAEIQALLPNGTYRAVVSQREITLALPFSAKAGDSLELEVVETDGKVALAFVANRTSAEQAGKQAESVSTTLSQAGKLIGNLMGNIDDQGKRAAPAPLNGNLPLLADFAKQAGNLAPILKDALTKSGIFYEAHQARWVAGELSTEALRQEPQGKMPATATVNVVPEGKTVNTPEATQANLVQIARPEAGSPIPRELTPIVQQQLDALATQNYAWQGQIWSGQKLWWEISENPENARSQDGDAMARWQTRLKLSLPALGGIDAVLHLKPGGDIAVTLTADSEASEARLRGDTDSLRSQLEAAGLKLTHLVVQHGEIAE